MEKKKKKLSSAIKCRQEWKLKIAVHVHLFSCLALYCIGYFIQCLSGTVSKSLIVYHTVSTLSSHFAMTELLPSTVATSTSIPILFFLTLCKIDLLFSNHKEPTRVPAFSFSIWVLIDQP